MARPAFLYILRCRDGSYYIGSTTNLETRLAQHQAGEGGDYTAQRLPVRLVYSSEFPTLREAFVAERQLKGWSRAKKEALIRGDYEALVDLARSKGAVSEHQSTERHPESLEGRASSNDRPSTSSG